MSYISTDISKLRAASLGDKTYMSSDVRRHWTRHDLLLYTPLQLCVIADKRSNEITLNSLINLERKFSHWVLKDSWESVNRLKLKCIQYVMCTFSAFPDQRRSHRAGPAGNQREHKEFSEPWHAQTSTACGDQTVFMIQRPERIKWDIKMLL